jgi:uncharacterized membrane protein
MQPKAADFRLRGHEVTRLEAFSDIVFGFALTLIVVSLEVPHTFDELMHAMRGFIAFAICFAILMWVWHAHHTFFRRYALTDGKTIVINAVLLFVVLFYVYPLKFMFSLVTGQIATTAKANTLFVIYGLGFAALFAIFLLLYAHAYHLRHELALNEVELFDTRTMMLYHGANVLIGVVSTLIGAFGRGGFVNFAGWIYFLLGPVSAWIGATRGNKRRKLHGESAQSRQVETVQTTPNTMHTDAVASVATAGPTRSDATPAASPDSAIVNVTKP